MAIMASTVRWAHLKYRHTPSGRSGSGALSHTTAILEKNPSSPGTEGFSSRYNEEGLTLAKDLTR